MKTPTQKTMGKRIKSLFGTETETKTSPREEAARAYYRANDIEEFGWTEDAFVEYEREHGGYAEMSAGLNPTTRGAGRVAFGISGFTLVEMVTTMAGSSILLIVAISAKMAGVWT